MAKKSPPPVAPPTEAQTGDAGGYPAHPGQKGPRLRGQKAATASPIFAPWPASPASGARRSGLPISGRGGEGKGGEGQPKRAAPRLASALPAPGRGGAAALNHRRVPGGWPPAGHLNASRDSARSSASRRRHRRNQARAGPIARLRLRERNPRGRVPHQQLTSQPASQPIESPAGRRLLLRPLRVSLSSHAGHPCAGHPLPPLLLQGQLVRRARRGEGSPKAARAPHRLRLSGGGREGGGARGGEEGCLAPLTSARPAPLPAWREQRAARGLAAPAARGARRERSTARGPAACDVAAGHVPGRPGWPAQAPGLF